MAGAGLNAVVEPDTTPVAVRSLCEFAARSGDLDHGFTPSPSADEGREGHREVTRRRPEHYLAELPLTGVCEGLALRGRADGYDPVQKRLEEIKTHRGDLSRLGAGKRALHLAQLRVYGALLCRAENLSGIELTLVYYDVSTGSETPITAQEDAESLWLYLSVLCRKYRHWAEAERAHRVARDRALTTLRFPFAGFRHGQRSLSESVYKTLMTGGTLLLQAPTGSGKTVGTLFPALLTLPRRSLDRLFYLTVRITGRQLALNGLQQIIESQSTPVPLRVLELSAREQACEYPDRACHGESCPLARGFFDNLDAARAELTQQQGVLDRNRLRQVALEHRLCPYYLTQEMARWADVVIGDVNHQFDQQASLHALTVQNDWRVALLIDEAHNLIDRARGMYSAELSQQRLLALKKTVPAALKTAFESLARRWRSLISETGANKNWQKPATVTVPLQSVPRSLDGALQGLISRITDYLAEQAVDARLQNLLFEAMAFLQLAQQFGEHSVCELSYRGPGTAVLAIHNLIPADFLRRRFEAGQATVLFSATLNPPDYQRHLLGLPGNSRWHELESPFQAAQLCVRIVPGISTRLRDRDKSLAPTVNRILSQFQHRPGNYLVYLSSFAYLDALYDAFQRVGTGVPTTRQRPGMNTEQRQAFIDSFNEAGQQVGFAVLGGAFAEGIDLPGSRLTGVFVLTLGLPPHDSRHEQLRERLQQRFGMGYEYAYLYPGCQKVIQAAGRLIRTPDDSGIIELIDDRFARGQVRRLLPRWWPQVALVAGKVAG